MLETHRNLFPPAEILKPGYNLRVVFEFACSWGNALQVGKRGNHSVQICGTLCSCRSLRIPEHPKVFLSPSVSLHEGFSRNWEAGLFHPAMRGISEWCRGLLNHHSDVRQQFPSFRTAESRRMYPLLLCQLLSKEIISHTLKSLCFYIHCTRVSALAT